MDIQQLVNLYVRVQVGCLLVGLAGNTLSFVVYSSRTFRRNSINVYCRALAVFDSLVILVQLPNMISIAFYNFDILTSSHAMCKLSVYASEFLPPISSWILVMFALDKMICVMFPNKLRIIRNTWFQLTLIAFILILNLSIFMIVPININVVHVPTVVVLNATNFTYFTPTCALQTLFFFQAINIVYLVEANFLPFLIMFVASVLTVRALIVSRSRVEALENRELKNRRAKDFKFAINSIVLDIIFVLFHTPVSVSFFIDIADLVTYYRFYIPTLIVYFANYSIPVFTYIISNSLFRRELFFMIGIRKRSASRHSRTNTLSFNR